jgi:ParB-like chromosome segregation protein Spo0J
LPVEIWPIGWLKPNPPNARTHSPEQIAEIAARQREFGWTQQVLAGADHQILAGHRHGKTET